MVDERETAQTSSARKLNSHALPCWILNKNLFCMYLFCIQATSAHLSCGPE